MEDRWLFTLALDKEIFFWVNDKLMIQANGRNHEPFTWQKLSVPYIEKTLKGKVLGPSSLVTWGKENE